MDGTRKIIYTMMRAHLTGITRDQLITALYLQSSFSAVRNKPGGAHSLCMHGGGGGELSARRKPLFCSALGGRAVAMPPE